MMTWCNHRNYIPVFSQVWSQVFSQICSQLSGLQKQTPPKAKTADMIPSLQISFTDSRLQQSWLYYQVLSELSQQFSRKNLTSILPIFKKKKTIAIYRPYPRHNQPPTLLVRCRSSQCLSGQRRSAWSVGLEEPTAGEAEPLPAPAGHGFHGSSKPLVVLRFEKKNGKNPRTACLDLNFMSGKIVELYGCLLGEFLLKRYMPVQPNKGPTESNMNINKSFQHKIFFLTNLRIDRSVQTPDFGPGLLYIIQS